MSIYSFPNDSNNPKNLFLFFSTKGLFSEFSDYYLSEVKFQDKYYRSAAHALQQYAFSSTILSEEAQSNIVANLSNLRKLFAYDFSLDFQEKAKRLMLIKKKAIKAINHAETLELKKSVVAETMRKIDQCLENIRDADELDKKVKTLRELIWTDAECTNWKSKGSSIYEDILRCKFKKNSVLGRLLMSTYSCANRPIVLIDGDRQKNNFLGLKLMELRNTLCGRNIIVNSLFTTFQSYANNKVLKRQYIEKSLTLEIPQEAMLWHRYYQDALVRGDKVMQQQLIDFLAHLNQQLLTSQVDNLDEDDMSVNGLGDGLDQTKLLYRELAKSNGKTKSVMTDELKQDKTLGSVKAAHANKNVEICLRHPLDLALSITQDEVSRGGNAKICVLTLSDLSNFGARANSSVNEDSHSLDTRLRTNIVSQLDEALKDKTFVDSNLVYFEANCFRDNWEQGYALLPANLVKAARYGFIHATCDASNSGWSASFYANANPQKMQKLENMIDNIYRLALAQGAKYLVLDALGYAKGYSAAEVAECYAQVHKRYAHCFEQVCFGLTQKQAFGAFQEKFSQQSAFKPTTLSGDVRVLFARGSKTVTIAPNNSLDGAMNHYLADGLISLFSKPGSATSLVGGFIVTQSESEAPHLQVNFSFANEIIAKEVAALFASCYAFTAPHLSFSSTADYVHKFVDQIVIDKDSRHRQSVGELMGRRMPHYTVSLKLARLEDLYSIVKFRSTNPYAFQHLAGQFLELLTHHHIEVRKKIGERILIFGIDHSYALVDDLLIKFYDQLASSDIQSRSAGLQSAHHAITTLLEHVKTDAKYQELRQFKEGTVLFSKLKAMAETLDYEIKKAITSPAREFVDDQSWRWSAGGLINAAKQHLSPTVMRMRSRLYHLVAPGETMPAHVRASIRSEKNTENVPVARSLSAEMDAATDSNTTNSTRLTYGPS